jgi:EpsI family protein
MKKLFAIVVICVFGLSWAGWFVHSYSKRQKSTPIVKPLSKFPLIVGSWTAKELIMQDVIIAKLGLNDYIMRDYTNKNYNGSINLYIGFFEKQVTGSLIHSPKHCLPGGGWIVVKQEERQLRDDSNAIHFPVNYMELKSDTTKMIALFWYQARGRRYANEFIDKLYLLIDAAVKGRTDGSLIRLLTIVPESDETGEKSVEELNRFALQMIPLLDDYLPN